MAGKFEAKKRPPEGGQNVLGRYETEYLVLVTTKLKHFER
jgi:hypothetical protein